jgi:protein CpxP
MRKFVIAVVVAATAAIAFAGPHGAYGRHGNGAAHMKRFAEKLGLSDAQKQQMSQIRKADFERNKQLYTDFRAKRQEFRQLKQANDPRAESVKGELESMKTQVTAARQAAHEQILGVLTPEQRQQLEQWRENRKPRQQ